MRLVGYLGVGRACRVQEAELDQTRDAARQHHPPLHRKPLIPHLFLELVFRYLARQHHPPLHREPLIPHLSLDLVFHYLPTCPRLRFRVKGFGMLLFVGLGDWGPGTWGVEYGV